MGAEPLAPEDAAAAVREATAGRGADAVVEAVGSPDASRLALALASPGGSIGAVGVHHEPSFAFPPAALYDKNLTYAAGRCSARHYLPEALALLAAGRWPFADLFTHRLPLAEGARGYEMFDRRVDGCVKVVLVP
jgi:threonine dehydrogenase-like Zn-dependent dehydrogenase